MGITPKDPAHFDPAMGNYKDLKPFRMWCQKVLPLVYDDSLSYYEVLCKLVDYLNKTMEDVGVLHDDVDALNEAYQLLQAYVNDYFSTLDVQEEINNKLDVMAEDGTLDALLLPYFNDYKTEINNIISTQNQRMELFENTIDNSIENQNTKLNTLESRMDTFASLTEGSTTGDAELQDIRVGVDGTIYPSAGDAVRAQVNNTNDTINHAFKVWFNSFDITLGTVHPSDTLFNCYVKSGDEFFVCASYDQNSTSEIQVKINYSDSTFFTDTLIANKVHPFKLNKDVVSIGIYTDGTLPTGHLNVYLYDYNSPANIENIIKKINTEHDISDKLLNIWATTFNVTLNQPHQGTKILDTRIKANEAFFIRTDYDQDSTSHFTIRVYYSDNTDSTLGSFTVNNTYNFIASKDIVGIGIYTDGSLPDGFIETFCYTHDSAANLSYVYDNINVINKKLDDIGVYTKIVYISGSVNTSKLIDSNGVITDVSDASYCTLTLELDNTKEYYVTASSNWNNPFYAFYNSNMELIEIGERSEAGAPYTYIEDKKINIPTDAVYIVINFNTHSASGKIGYSDGYTQSKDPVWSGIKWACVGDSLTAVNIRTDKHYFDYVQEATGIIPVNMGVDGTGYARGSGYNQAFYQRILNIDPDCDVVTIFGSFNDLGAGLPLGSYTDNDITTVAGCVNKTIQNLQSVIPGVIVGIVAPTPWATTRPIVNSVGYTYTELLKAITQYNSIPFFDLYRESNLRPWDADFRELCYSKDEGNGVHPNELGHKIIAPKFENFLSELLLR